MKSEDSNNRITILLVDDHPLVREALRNALDNQSDYKIIGEAGDGELAIQLAAELNPDVIIMDITMPKVDGLEAIKQIKSNNCNVGILALTVHDDEEMLLNTLQAGADGYLTKSIIGKDVVSAIHALTSGEMVLQPHVLRKLLLYASQKEPVKPLYEKKANGEAPYTFRELQTLKLISKGASNKEIASQLGLSVRTVKGHLLTLFARMNAKSRTEAIIIGLRTGILSIDDLVE